MEPDEDEDGEEEDEMQSKYNEDPFDDSQSSESDKSD